MLGGHLRTLPVGEIHVGSSEGLGSIAGLVRSSDSDVGGCRCPAARDGRRGENDVFRPLRGIASGFVRARLISCGERGLAGLPYVPGSCERPHARCEGRAEVRGTSWPAAADSMTTTKRPPLVLRRDQGYIGVLVDDLVTKARFFKDDKFHDPCVHFPSALFSRSSEHVAPSTQ